MVSNWIAMGQWNHRKYTENAVSKSSKISENSEDQVSQVIEMIKNSKNQVTQVIQSVQQAAVFWCTEDKVTVCPTSCSVLVH